MQSIISYTNKNKISKNNKYNNNKNKFKIIDNKDIDKFVNLVNIDNALNNKFKKNNKININKFNI